MSAINNLIKAHKAKAITKDDYSLKDYQAKFSDKEGIAIIPLIGIETKYIPSFDQSSPQWNGQGQGNGHRTRFIIEGGETIGSFSSASHQLFVFFAELLGYRGDESFLHIDITGKVNVAVSVLKLDKSKSTYQFDVIEDGSDLRGFTDYLPTTETMFQLEGSPVTNDAEEVEQVLIEEPTTKKK